jgi:D-alanyl-lipoteichoic acid acyltransferase DltB (MBOAT superfamily)
LVAGPIERANHLLPQIQKKRIFNYSEIITGFRLILWGLFKKIVIADNCAYFANEIFDNFENYNGASLYLGVLFFTFQIYGDFSGYSDIALGSAKLLGFDLLINFRFPYFSRDLAEFWKRWHISLSSWFRDYLYIPLGGSQSGKIATIRNTFIIFIVSGFWHGASWNFILWGGIHALGFLPLLILGKSKRNLSNSIAENTLFPSFSELIKVFLTFNYVVIAWIFFRAKSIGQSFSFIKVIFSESMFSIPNFNFDNAAKLKLLHLGFTLIFMLIFEWASRKTDSSVYFFNLISSNVLRWALYILIIIFMIYFKGDSVEFIYFAF